MFLRFGWCVLLCACSPFFLPILLQFVRNFSLQSLYLKCTTVLINRQILMNVKKCARAHKHTHLLSLNRHTNKTPVFSALSSNECSIVCFSEMLVTSERANESKRAHLKLTELHKTIGNSL